MTEQPKRQRRRRPRKRACSRDGCDRRVTNGPGRLRYCTATCRAVDNELIRIRRICEVLGPTKVTADLWNAAVAVSDALTECQTLSDRVKALATSVGITAEQ
ncbi:hypothetical protein [Mycobacterium avium]|uniref:hypothetical protein n=1 Tax=Mycobacterium avium TaxID=1764 RepID=UPI0015CA8999|nr:hypothetical protein [Mycobacterium avium]